MTVVMVARSLPPCFVDLIFLRHRVSMIQLVSRFLQVSDGLLTRDSTEREGEVDNLKHVFNTTNLKCCGETKKSCNEDNNRRVKWRTPWGGAKGSFPNTLEDNGFLFQNNGKM